MIGATGLLIDQPLLLLFVVAAIAYPLGRVRLYGTTLGVAAVLFVGLAFGALDPALELPEFAYVFGLVLFVYSVGLTSAAGLVSSFNRAGARELALVLGVLVAAAGGNVVVAQVLSLTPGAVSGIYAGSLTNTPALASVLEHARASEGGEAAATEAIIAYSLTYPIGVVGVLATLAVARRRWNVSDTGEQRRLEAAGVTRAEPVSRSIRITRDEGALHLDALRRQRGWRVVFGRLRRGDSTALVDTATRAEAGDIVTVVGTPDAIATVIEYLGAQNDQQIDLDRRALDYRRMFVSSPKVAGRRLGELALPAQFGAVVTRVRRGDVDMVAHDDLVLELGDRVRVLTDRSRLDAVSSFFGDSYRALSELDTLAFSVGPAAGLLIGMIPIPLPGGIELRLGIAGGPLLVALVLGFIERSGPIVWVLPYSANLTLRQIGLMLFLAAIGTRAGWEFRSLLTTGGGLTLIAAGAVVTCLTAFVTLWFAYRVLEMPFALAGGLVAALQTQPAVLAFAVEQARDDLPNVAYARIYPLALVSKIVLAQLVFETLT